ncbi:alpha/beta fold hydrolase [Microbacterium thalassium]|uniref:Pimeloyl-ACP methyl ester carboxylesterase n=1 Tax=Microbacterium thalassium TaxID=362649 RepID=A0A7X0FME1_9MICO|nr:alpha/beta fold hydrolase [Microbacterium thalassium]MBB6390200.1 pimeloyl-ACP methyl ester carboxylesterase [Microbacterium thalassium]GLK25308.1 esterase [Microbacterium thalassium]
MAPSANAPTFVLIAGYRLGAWAWDEVRDRLTALGRRVIPMTLPGLDETDPDRASRSVEDQAAAIERVLTSEAGPAVVVAHSGANVPVSVVLDRHPEAVRRVIWVDSGPVAPDYAPSAPEELEELPLPPFDVLGEAASLEGLTADVLARFRRRAVPEPGPVVCGSVQLSNDARRRVPTKLVCCSIPSGELTALAEAGHPMFAEVAELEHLELVDLPTGHWPMWSRPAELAQILAGAASTAD